jgi:PPOX class probable F420-dependent enzyme
MQIPDGYEDLFSDESLAFLAVATIRPDGSPVVAPVWFVADEHGLVFSTGVDSVKARDMRAKPSIAGMVMAEGQHLRYVSIRGTAHEVTDPPSEGIDSNALYGRIVRRYEGHDPSEPHADVFFRLVPTRMTGYDYRSYEA